MPKTQPEQVLRVRFALENHDKLERSLRLYLPVPTWEAAGSPRYISIERIGQDLVLVPRDRVGPEESPGYSLLRSKDGYRCWCNEASDVVRREPGSYLAQIRADGRIYVTETKMSRGRR